MDEEKNRTQPLDLILYEKQTKYTFFFGSPCNPFDYDVVFFYGGGFYTL